MAAGDRRPGQLSRVAARLPIYWSNMRDSPRWLPMFTLGRFLLVRQALWRLARESASYDCSSSMFPGSDTRAALNELRGEGLFAGLQMPKHVSAEILRFAQSTPCFANLSRQVEFLPSAHADTVGRLARPMLTGHYFDRVENCAAVAAVRDDPLLRATAAGYLGHKACVISTRLWWSFPTSDASDADLNLASQEKLHFDLDDWRALKFFFYLTPVDRDGGPRVYVRRTHNRRLARHQWTLVVGHPNVEVLDAMVRRTGSRCLAAPGMASSRTRSAFTWGRWCGTHRG